MLYILRALCKHSDQGLSLSVINVTRLLSNCLSDCSCNYITAPSIILIVIMVINKLSQIKCTTGCSIWTGRLCQLTHFDPTSAFFPHFFSESICASWHFYASLVVKAINFWRWSRQCDHISTICFSFHCIEFVFLFKRDTLLEYLLP